MGKYSQVSAFSIEGRFLEFVLEDGYKIKYIKLINSQSEFTIKLSKELRFSTAYSLIPGDWLQILGEKKFDPKTGEIKLKAYDIKRVNPRQTETVTSVKLEPQSIDASSAKPKANILVCQKSDCWKHGGKAVCQALQQEISDRGLEGEVAVKQVGCMKQCKAAPNIVVNKTRYSDIDPKQVPQIIDKHFGAAPVLAKPVLCPTI